jgi:histidyl-tRNA synthetase
VISLVLKKFAAFPSALGASPAQVLVTLFDPSCLTSSFQVASSLRNAGIPTALYPEVSKLSKQFKHGDRMGMRLAVVIGPDEQAHNLAAVKDLKTGEQRLVPLTGLVEAVRQLID